LRITLLRRPAQEVWAVNAYSAASADDGRPCWSGSGLFGDELWPGESQLVRYEVEDRASRPGRLVGLGDFRPLRIEPRGGEL
jgi:hypothetical protein